MKQVILDFPKQFETGLKAAENVGIKGEFENIVICGVGGSALPGSLLPEMGIKFDLPLFVHRGYGLPKAADQNSLILAISYSGNTEETISAYEESLAKNYKVIAITTGGKLQEMAEKNNRPAVLIPKTGIPPRCATGYLMAAVLKVLSNCGIIADQSNRLLEMAENLKPAELETQGKKLAKKLKGKIPIIYSSDSFKSLARIWKIKFNENSKVMAFWNYFPELNHNEMVGYTRIKNQESRIKDFHIIILRDGKDNPKILRRMELTAELIKESGAEVDFIEMTGETKLEKIFNALLLGDWVSYYLALEYNIDPVPVKIVEEFKKRLT